MRWLFQKGRTRYLSEINAPNGLHFEGSFPVRFPEGLSIISGIKEPV